jgi:hypothetical protein
MRQQLIFMGWRGPQTQINGRDMPNLMDSLLGAPIAVRCFLKADSPATDKTAMKEKIGADCQLSLLPWTAPRRVPKQKKWMNTCPAS